MNSRSVNGRDWLVAGDAPEGAGVKLFCLGHAGAGASVFYAWREALAPGAQVIAVRLPGRETRLLESPIADYTSAVEALADAIEPSIDGQTAFFGHCMGALLAFGAVVALEARGHTIAKLIVSGQAAPPTLIDDEPRISALSRPELRAFLATLGGMDAELLANDEFFAMVEPAIRADFALGETYPGSQKSATIAAPIVAFGTDDDPLAPVATVEAWREASRSSCQISIRSGGHFLADDDWIALAQQVVRAVEH
jgi:medium-chain acyl-[acyl-carrier-protein] hydrolase